MTDTSTRPRMGDEELLPCPFCGAPAEMDAAQGYLAISSGKLGSRVTIYCTSCGADMGWCREDHRDMPVEEMIWHVREDWNRRASLPQPPARSTGEVPARETAWLVERQCQPPQYLTSEHTGGWSSDAWRAYRFSTERAADNTRLKLPDYLRDESKAIEHMFINKRDGIEAASTPAQSGLADDAIVERASRAAWPQTWKILDESPQGCMPDVIARRAISRQRIMDDMRHGLAAALSHAPSQPAPVVAKLTEEFFAKIYVQAWDQHIGQDGAIAILNAIDSASPQESEKCRHPNRGLARCTLKRIGDTEHFICQTIGCASMPSTSSTRPQATEPKLPEYKCAGGVEIVVGPCPKCGATDNDVCPFTNFPPLTEGGG